MNRRLFFLKQDGWFEAEIASKLLVAPEDELIRWAYAMMERYGYRNYRITEGPEVKFASLPICQCTHAERMTLVERAPRLGEVCNFAVIKR